VLLHVVEANSSSGLRNTPRHLDARIIALSGTPLSAAVERTFRQDRFSG
jgi:hypothetical protein